MTHPKARARVIPICDASGAFREPTLEEILSDSIVKAVMRADAVDPGELRALLGQVAHARGLAAETDILCLREPAPSCGVT